MEPWRPLALLVSSLALISDLVALSTDFWLHPRDTELQHPGRPVGPGVPGRAHPALHLLIVCPRPHSPGLHHHRLCCSFFHDSCHDRVYHPAVGPASAPPDPDFLLLVFLPGLGLGFPLGLHSSLRGMGVKHSLQRGGTLLSLLANILMVLSAATNYWSRYPDGHSGLWQECHQGVCSISPCQTMLAVTGACMVLAAGSGIVGMAMGLKIVSRHGDALRGQSTSAILFLSGLLLLIALTGYTVKDAWKSDVFFSWSYFAGWLALPFSILAGFGFLLADMILQSTDAISGFPVCL
ncbi:claudin domain-containing protein 2 isoform X9 [Choloepus didactylus]|uniref:claudin domain-containing protein 2 isoform X9 n=1 Tax=Choloepus didactylus TaxID=27675 RepID=UPI00189EFB6E|nr:claudin domain-containing protein 2 isoform X9 [Choloepus didactylus]